MRPFNTAVLIAVLTTTQCKTVEGQRAESASATCAADTVACLARILERHGGLERFRRLHYAQHTATDDYSFPFTLFKPWPNKAAAWTMKADRANADQVMTFPGSDILLGVDAAGGWASAPGYAHGAGKFGRLTQFFLSIPFRMADSGARTVRVHDSTWLRLYIMTVEVEFDPTVTLSPNKKWSFHFAPVDLTALGATFYFTADYSTVNMRIDGWREAEGLQIPARLRVMGGPVHSPIRTITITDAQLTETRPEPPKDADRIQ